MADAKQQESAGLLRRLGAILYDTFLVIAMLVAITFFFVPFLDGRVLVPKETGVVAYAYRLLQIVAVVLFFGFFWTRRGQTIGMLAWRLRLEKLDGSAVPWRNAVWRIGTLFALLLPFFIGDWVLWRDWPRGLQRTSAIASSLAPLALCYLWILIDRERLAWHDRWSHTRIVVVPKAG